jgi:hypothetical protein
MIWQGVKAEYVLSRDIDSTSYKNGVTDEKKTMHPKLLLGMKEHERIIGFNRRCNPVQDKIEPH